MTRSGKLFDGEGRTMATAEEYEVRIQQLDDWNKLRKFWETIKVRDTPGWDQGRAFEYLVLQAFHLDGGIVRWPYSVMLENEVIEQIDGAVHMGRFSCLVESKHTVEAVAIAPLAKMRNQLLRRHSGMIGLIFSYSGFTEPTLLLAQYLAPQSILLWTGDEVEQVLQDEKIAEYLEYKYRSCVETGIPDTSIRKSSTQEPVTTR
jgi:hypothetical protein